MSQTTIQLRIDSKTKKEAKKTIEHIGLDLSSAVKLFLRNVVITGSIPLNLKTENGFTLAQELKLLDEVKNLKTASKGYATAEELHSAVLGEL